MFNIYYFRNLIWVTSDTHFFHQKLIENGVRKPEFNKEIIAQWNTLVSPDDTVIHCGDVIMASHQEVGKVLKKLNGIKILVRGNHDQQRGANFWLNMGFAFVCDSFKLKYQGLTIKFSHKPRASLNTDLNIHGHVHSEYRRSQLTFALTQRHINVAIDENELKLIQLDKIIQNYRTII